MDDGLERDTPERSLFLLRHGMSNALEVTAGLTRLPRVPFRLFYALLALASQQIAQNHHFNPLRSLEFRPEFDRIANPRMLAVVRAVPGENARRLVALTFLSLFRMLRYLTLAEASLNESAASPKRRLSTVYAVLAVLRADGRALASHLRRSAGSVLSETFDAEIFAVPASELAGSYERLLDRARWLRHLRGALEAIAANLRLEMRRTFERDFPVVDGALPIEGLEKATERCAQNLRPTLQSAVMFLAETLDAELDPNAIFDDVAAKRSLSERLRRDVWMFAQIARAFSLKARSLATASPGVWVPAQAHTFVKEFAEYFRGMGYPLLRAAGYEGSEALIETMQRLRSADTTDATRLERTAVEVDRFIAFAQAFLEKVDARAELAGCAFDRRAAAASLKMYLGEQLALTDA
jgi:hypothetical protein